MHSPRATLLRVLFQQWLARWHDLMACEIVPVAKSADAQRAFRRD